MADPTMTMDLYAHPQFATELGHLMVCSAKLEWHLSRLYHLLSGSPPDVARTSFYGMSNARTKVVALKGLSVVVLPADAAKRNEDILNRAYKRIKLRNRYAHSPFAHSETGQVCLMRMDNEPADYDLEEVNLNEIRSVTEGLQNSCEEVTQRIVELEKVAPKHLEKLREAPGIRLRFAKKGASRPK